MSGAVIAGLTLAALVVIGLRTHEVWQSPGHKPGVLMCLVLALLMLVLTGCQTAPEEAPRYSVACEPLPLCDIPPKASSTQLEIALLACIHEYRALYSSCATRQPAGKP